ncbi:TonB-dependent receptor plug domain-containing protein [Weeksellaceae bacterium TAE3-ERU29]|nr:TonB-dependent receptor plug domain-containing protein [Weeksellaceae bacterium TAE3-ERU29]
MLLKSYIRDFIKNSLLLLGLLCGLGTYAQIEKDTPKKEKDSLSIFDKVNVLPEVVIQAKTLARQIKEGPMAVEVLELEPILSKTGSLLDVMIRVPGVNARSDGSIGDPVNFAINGLDKKSIVLFKDGIPMSFYGHSFEPGHVSASMFERIEVYKGVLPIGLGADALGGGINFITRKPKYKSLDVSVETGSFNTQHYTLNTFIPTKSGLYTGANVSYVQSNNNWYVDVGREGDKGWDIFDGTVKARLKNNGVNMYSGEYFVGIRNKKWAEELQITFINSWFYKRINHYFGYRFDSAAQALYAYANDKTISGVISYKGKFFKDKLKTDILAGYGKSQRYRKC